MNFAWSARREPDGMAVSPESDAAKESRSGSHVESARGVYPLYFAANAAPRVAMLVVLIVLTRLLPTTEYGLFALVVTTGEILEMASSNWIRVYLLRTEAGANELRPRRLGRSLALSAGCALAGLVISVAVAPFIAGERAAAMMLATAAYIAAFALLRLTLDARAALAQSPDLRSGRMRARAGNRDGNDHRRRRRAAFVLADVDRSLTGDRCRRGIRTGVGVAQSDAPAASARRLLGRAGFRRALSAGEYAVLHHRLVRPLHRQLFSRRRCSRHLRRRLFGRAAARRTLHQRAQCLQLSATRAHVRQRRSRKAPGRCKAG